MSPKERLSEATHDLAAQAESLEDMVSDRPENPDTAREAILESVEAIRETCEKIEKIVA